MTTALDIATLARGLNISESTVVSMVRTAEREGLMRSRHIRSAVTARKPITGRE